MLNMVFQADRCLSSVGQFLSMEMCYFMTKCAPQRVVVQALSLATVLHLCAVLICQY